MHANNFYKEFKKINGDIVFKKGLVESLSMLNPGNKHWVLKSNPGDQLWLLTSI